MSTINPAKSHAQTKADWGHNYVIAEQEMLLELQDSMNAMELGVVPLVGDAGGSGSDTIRVRSIGSVGWAQRFAAMSGEADRITPVAFTSGYNEVTVAQHGLAYEETFFTQVIGGSAQGVSLEELKAMVPSSWLATWRYKVAQQGAGFSVAVGSASTELSVDDMLDMKAASRTNKAGSLRLGGLVDPAQINQLLESVRNEPGFDTPETFARIQGFSEQIWRDVLGLGIDLAVTDDIQQDSGAYQGFVHSPGGIGWAVANSMPANVPNREQAIYLPQYGLVIWKSDSRGDEMVDRFNAMTVFGVAERADQGAPVTSFKRRLISQV